MQRRYPGLYSLPCSGWGEMDSEASMAENQPGGSSSGPAGARSLACTVWLFWILKAHCEEKVSPWLTISTQKWWLIVTAEVTQPSFPRPPLLCPGGPPPHTHTHNTHTSQKPTGELRSLVTLSGFEVACVCHFCLVEGKESIFKELQHQTPSWHITHVCWIG